MPWDFASQYRNPLDEQPQASERSEQADPGEPEGAQPPR